MALVHTTDTRNAAASVVLDRIDAGAGAGKLQLTSVPGDYVGAELLAEIVFADPAFSAPVGGTASAASLPRSDPSADNSGDAVEFRLVDSDDTEVFRGTVTESGMGGDITMPSVTITQTETVELSQLSYTAPV